MREVETHEKYMIEKGNAVISTHRGSTASVRRVHGIIKHEGSIEEGIEDGYRAMSLPT